MMLMPHICCASMTVNEASVARRRRGTVNSSVKRLTYVDLLRYWDSSRTCAWTMYRSRAACSSVLRRRASEA
jgi:hypothetical protein